MGTNYYYTSVTDTCPHCGRGDKSEELHIGKSSAGWVFSLRIHPDKGINDLPDWEALFSKPGARIRDEYGEEYTPAQMLAQIKERKWHMPYPDKVLAFNGVSNWEEYHRRNHSLEGPAGLHRHQLGDGCVKHGAGTWDCIDAEFS